MISLTVTEAKSLKAKTIGLIGAKKPYLLLLRTHFGIHTFGMRFPIDVIVLDKTNRIVSLKQSLRTNRVYLWNPLYNTVIEAPEGTIAKKQITKGLYMKITT